jgi:AAA+ ATPase superfamily predicted ATPase
MEIGEGVKLMARFIDRQQEFRELDEVLGERGAHFIVVYGRRRVGKTTLLLNWVQHIDLPSFYWVARRETQ